MQYIPVLVIFWEANSKGSIRMKRFRWLFLTGVVLASAALAQTADRYELDPNHTQIGFGVKHLVISTVKGKFNEFSGTILYDPADITKSSVSITIKAASIDTGVQKRDDHLRSPDFFDAAKYPELTFKSQRIEKQGDGFVAFGTLTMHGVAKEIALPFTLTGPIKDPWGRSRMAVEGALTINRHDWGLTYNQVMEAGGLVVGNEVKIEINVEAVKG